ncbi:MAG: flagellar basal body-associated FliL family protein [Treponemataceae bacterium]|nr:flagellar basal body-associated FliL family protein [Treponemataceae bacterium]
MAETTVFQKILIYILISLVIAIGLLSALLFLTGSLNKTDAASVQTAYIEEAAQEGYDFAVFDGIGSLRLSTCDEDPVPVVLSIYFYYSADDSLYYEELCTKTRALKAVITSYFSSQTVAQLRKKGESTVKTQLKSMLNKELVLGKIDELYFSEYIFFD